MRATAFRGCKVFFWGAVALLFCLTAIAQNAAKPRRSADQVAIAFYKAYLSALKQGKEPIDDPHGFMQQFVANSLLNQITREIRAGGMESDYFIRAQDYEEDWENNVSASHPRIIESRASTIVTLGASAQTRQRLNLILTLDDGVWKIRRVSAAP